MKEFIKSRFATIRKKKQPIAVEAGIIPQRHLLENNRIKSQPSEQTVRMNPLEVYISEPGGCDLEHFLSQLNQPELELLRRLLHDSLSESQLRKVVKSYGQMPAPFIDQINTKSLHALGELIVQETDPNTYVLEEELRVPLMQKLKEENK